MKKILYLIILGMLPILIAKSQLLAINLNITWEEVLIEEKEEIVPFLNIVYHNISDSPIFFVNFFDNDKQRPPIPCEFRQPESTICERIQKYEEKPDQNFYVPMSSLWEILDTMEGYDEERELSVYNCDYQYFYRCLKTKGIYSQLNDTSANNIKEQNIEGLSAQQKSKLIFLRPNENYTAKFNLIPFQKIKGTYNFFLDVEKLSNVIFTYMSRWSEEKQEWENVIPLPEQIGEYKLYTGEFFTNSLIVEFK